MKCAKALRQGGVSKTREGDGDGALRTIRWGRQYGFYPGCHWGPQGSGVMF